MDVLVNLIPVNIVSSLYCFTASTAFFRYGNLSVQNYDVMRQDGITHIFLGDYFGEQDNLDMLSFGKRQGIGNLPDLIGQ